RAKPSSRSAGSNKDRAAAPSVVLPVCGTRPTPGPQPTMPERSSVAILASGRGSNMAALVYAARAPDCAYEVALVTGDRPEAPALPLAEAEGVDVDRLPAPTPKDKSQFFDALSSILEGADVDLIALA